MNKYNRILQKVDFRNPTDIHKYSRLFAGNVFGFLHTKINGDNLTIYRSRLHSTPNTLYTNYNELMSPPKSVCPLGRANYPGEPIFYASDRISTTIEECKPYKNNFISTIELDINKDELEIMILGRINRYEIDQSQLSPESIEINNFLDQELRKVIDQNNKLDYYKTATFFQSQTPNLDNSIDAIIYPSVASKLKGDNYIFSQEFINKNSFFKSLIVSQIIDIDENGNYITECKFKSYKLSEEKDFVYARILNCEGHNFIDEEYH